METTTARTRSGLEITSDTPHADRPKLRGRPKKDHAPVIDTDILKVATEMFAEKGYASTTMEAIAIKVGITKRTLYVRYPDKVALFKTVLDRLIRNAGVPDPVSFPDMRACLMHHTENYFIIASDPTMRVLRSLGTGEVLGVPELSQIAEEMTRDVGIVPIAQTIRDTASKEGLKVGDPEFIAASILDLARGHSDRVEVLKLRSDFASYKFAAERIVNMLMAQIQSENPLPAKGQ